MAAARKGIALAFTGQGSQRVGMIKDLLERWPKQVGPVLEEAEEAMKFNLKKLMIDGPQEELTQTFIAQPAILTHSYAVLQILKHEVEFDVSACSYALGHSLGQFTALVAANALTFHDAVDLVHFRGKAMMEAMAGQADPGAMAALLPVSPSLAEEICEQVEKTSGLVCQVANYNSSKQTVISGNLSAIDQAVQLAKERKVRRAVKLDVSAPFHCKLMQPAAEKLAEKLNGISFQAPNVPVVCNVSGDVLPADAIAHRLSDQVVKPVKWSQSVDLTMANGTSEFLELGYGGVLTGLIKQHAPSASCTSLGTADEVAAFVQSKAK